jgi:hypothetical protein
MQIDPNRPATLIEVMSLMDAHARGVGFLIGLALAQISPDAADRFYDAVSSLPNDGTDRDAFIDCAIDGIESARYDLNPDTDD